MEAAIINLEKRKINYNIYKNILLLIVIIFFSFQKISLCNEKGKILAHISGCYGCHTSNEERPFSGGYKIKTKYGTFISPNITFDSKQGIGNWTLEQFSIALKYGISPKGKPYYPVLPYKWYSSLKTSDIENIYNYLKTVKTTPIKQDPHKLKFPYNIRELLWVRRIIEENIYESKKIQIQNKKEEEGAYIVKSLAHCGACHSPRIFFSIVKNLNNLEGRSNSHKNINDGAPNISSDINNGIGSWDDDDIVFFLQTGFKPDGDYAEGHMEKIIENGTSFLTEGELQSIAAYLLSSHNN